MKRKQPGINERPCQNDRGVRPQLGEPGYFCLELFCGSGNLTFAMKHFFPDSFGVDHKVGKQRVKIVCLDLTKPENQDLIFLGVIHNTVFGYTLVSPAEPVVGPG